MKKHYNVVAAVIIINDLVFCAQRGYGSLKDKWEFPGGKIEQGETEQEALAREIKEELDTDIDVKEHLITTSYEYDDFSITLHAYRCEVIKGNLLSNEHEDETWCAKENLMNKDWCPADIAIVEKILNSF